MPLRYAFEAGRLLRVVGWLVNYNANPDCLPTERRRGCLCCRGVDKVVYTPRPAANSYAPRCLVVGGAQQVALPTAGPSRRLARPCPSRRGVPPASWPTGPLAYPDHRPTRTTGRGSFKYLTLEEGSSTLVRDCTLASDLD